jgi:hypothetical protein
VTNSTMAATRLARVQLKIQRSRKHIDDLRAVLDTFGKSVPYKVGFRRDAATRKGIYYVSHVEEVPPEIALVAADAIQTLRSSLDHLAWQLVEANGQTPTSQTAFPICDTPQQVQDATDKVRGMSNGAISLIQGAEPYRGGGNDLWVLHRLNIIDKHRLLLTVASKWQRMDIMPAVLAIVDKSRGPEDKITANLGQLHLAGDIAGPLKVGDELFIDGPDAEPNDKITFDFAVCIYEPDIFPNAVPLLETVEKLYRNVENMIPWFASVL